MSSISLTDDESNKLREYLSYFKPVLRKIISPKSVDEIFEKLAKNLDKILSSADLYEDIRQKNPEVNEVTIRQSSVAIIIYFLVFLLKPERSVSQLIEAFNEVAQFLTENPTASEEDFIEQLNKSTAILKLNDPNKGPPIFEARFRTIMPSGVRPLKSTFGQAVWIVVKSLLPPPAELNMTAFLFTPIISAIVKNPEVISKDEGIDPTLFSEELMARRRRYIDLSIDYESLLNDKSLKINWNQPLPSNVSDLIFADSLKAQFLETRDFVPRTLFESRVNKFYNDNIGSLQKLKENVISAMTNPERFFPEIPFNASQFTQQMSQGSPNFQKVSKVTDAIYHTSGEFKVNGKPITEDVDRRIKNDIKLLNGDYLRANPAENTNNPPWTNFQFLSLTDPSKTITSSGRQDLGAIDSLHVLRFFFITDFAMSDLDRIVVDHKIETSEQFNRDRSNLYNFKYGPTDSLSSILFRMPLDEAFAFNRRGVRYVVPKDKSIYGYLHEHNLRDISNKELIQQMLKDLINQDLINANPVQESERIQVGRNPFFFRQIPIQLIKKVEGENDIIYNLTKFLQEDIKSALRNITQQWERDLPQRSFSTITPEFQRIISSIGNGITPIDCKDIFFFEDTTSSTEVGMNTIIDMQRFADAIIPEDKKFSTRPDRLLPTGAYSIYRNPAVNPIYTCDHYNPNSFEPNINRISSLEDLLDYFKTNDPGSSKFKKFTKYVSFIYLFFDCLPKAQYVVNSLLKSLSIIFRVFIRHINEPMISPYELIRVINYAPYNISELQTVLVAQKDVRKDIVTCLSKVIEKIVNVNKYYHAIINLLGLSFDDIKDRKIFVDRVNDRSDSEIREYIYLLLQKHAPSLPRLDENKLVTAYRAYLSTTLSSYAFPLEKDGVNLILTRLFGIRDDNFESQLFRFIIGINIPRDLLITRENLELYDKYIEEEPRIAAFNVEKNDQETFSITGERNNVEELEKQLYSARINYVVTPPEDNKLAIHFSANTMIRPCFIHPLFSMILPCFIECDGVLDVDAQYLVTPVNSTKITAVIEYPAEVIVIRNYSLLFNDKAGPNTMQEAFIQLQKYLPNGYVKTSPSELLIIRTRSGRPVTLADFPNGIPIRLVNLFNISEIVEGSVGVVNRIARPRTVTKLITHRPHHTWFNHPLNATTPGEGAIYIPKSVKDEDQKKTIQREKIFIPVVDTDLFLSSFFSPILQLEYMQRLAIVLGHIEGWEDLRASVEAHRKLAGGEIEEAKLRSRYIEDLVVDNCRGFRNLLLSSKAGTSIELTFNDESLGFLDNVDLDKETMAFLSEQENERSLSYGVTFNGYIRLFQRRRERINKLLKDDDKALLTEEETRAAMARKINEVAIDVKKANMVLVDAESQFINEALLNAVWHQPLV